MTRLVFVNGHQKDMCCYKIGLCVQRLITNLGSIGNLIGRA